MESSLVPNHQLSRKTLEIQCIEIENPQSFGVRGLIALQTAIEPKAFDDVGANPPANGIGGFEYLKRHTALREPSTARQPR